MGKKQVRFDASQQLVDRFDEALDEHAGYESRAEAFRDFMRYLSDDTLGMGGDGK